MTTTNEESTANTSVQKRSVIASLATRLDCDPAKLVPMLKKTAFATCRTDEEFMAMCMVSNTYNLNPILKEIYAFPSKSGAVVPIVSIDGWLKIINRHPAMDGVEFIEDDASCTAIIHRKDREHPTKATEWLDECKGNTEPWKRWPRRMLRHKALIQCARIAFGFGGIYDEDEGRRIEEAANATMDKPSRARRATATEIIDAEFEESSSSTPAESSAPAPAPVTEASTSTSGDFLLH